MPSRCLAILPADDCPRNCSGHGTCVASAADPAKKECQCSEGFGAKDCSLVSTALEFGKTVTQEPAAFERTLFQLPAPTGEWLLALWQPMSAGAWAARRLG